MEGVAAWPALWTYIRHAQKHTIVQLSHTPTLSTTSREELFACGAHDWNLGHLEISGFCSLLENSVI